MFAGDEKTDATRVEACGQRQVSHHCIRLVKKDDPAVGVVLPVTSHLKHEGEFTRSISRSISISKFPRSQELLIARHGELLSIQGGAQLELILLYVT